jgi:hypothetical protein
MKALLLLIVGIVLNAQTVGEPKYINSFAALGQGGDLIELERAIVEFHSKVRALPGYASVRMTAEFKPGRSPVRLPRDVQFVVRGRAPIDPVTRYELLLLKASKSHREFVMTTAHGSVFGARSTTKDEAEVTIHFDEYGAESYRIVPDQPLAPGEYALAVRGLATEAFCFGVDK